MRSQYRALHYSASRGNKKEYKNTVAYVKTTFWRKMFYHNNVLLNVLARSCKENAVAIADAYIISLFDLLHLNSSCLKNMLWYYFTDIVHFNRIFNCSLVPDY